MNTEKHLLEWLTENESASVIMKIAKVRSLLGNGNSFTLLRHELEDGSEGVDLQIEIDDYEDDNNREGIWFGIDVQTSHEETFERITEALDYFKKRVSQI